MSIKNLWNSVDFYVWKMLVYKSRKWHKLNQQQTKKTFSKKVVDKKITKCYDIKVAVNKRQQNEPWKLNKQNVDITVFLNWKTKILDIKIDAS